MNSRTEYTNFHIVVNSFFLRALYDGMVETKDVIEAIHRMRGNIIEPQQFKSWWSLKSTATNDALGPEVRRTH